MRPAFGQGDRGDAVGRDVDDVPLGDEDAADERRHLRLVLDHQDPHGAIVRPEPVNRKGQSAFVGGFSSGPHQGVIAAARECWNDSHPRTPELSR